MIAARYVELHSLTNSRPVCVAVAVQLPGTCSDSNAIDGHNDNNNHGDDINSINAPHLRAKSTLYAVDCHERPCTVHVYE